MSKNLEPKSSGWDVLDEIDYFPKRDKYKAGKNIGSDWNKLKKQKSAKSIKVQPPQPPPEEEKKK